MHLFGSGHSRIMVEEMWPRYGSFPGFNPIVELSLSFHNLVVGANGQRQAMFLENVPGLAERILRNFALSDKDCALIISSSGCNIVPIEMAEIFQQKKIKTVALITKEHAAKSNSKRSDGKKLSDFADIVLDSGAPVGDAMIYIDGLILGHITALKLNDEEAEELCGGTDEAALRSLGIPEVVLTLGSEGAVIISGEVTTRVDAVPIDGPVDPTGAGDSFLLSYAVARQRGADPHEAGLIASRFVSTIIAR